MMSGQRSAATAAVTAAATAAAESDDQLSPVGVTHRKQKEGLISVQCSSHRVIEEVSLLLLLLQSGWLPAAE